MSLGQRYARAPQPILLAVELLGGARAVLLCAELSFEGSHLSRDRAREQVVSKVSACGQRVRTAAKKGVAAQRRPPSLARHHSSVCKASAARSAEARCAQEDDALEEADFGWEGARQAIVLVQLPVGRRDARAAGQTSSSTRCVRPR